MGSVNSIESCSMIDGPGIRTVVFLNECHLRCKYCHNPEMLLKSADNYKSEDLAKAILKNKPYFKNGGGVTFSGGEPLLQTQFLTEVTKILKKENVHVAIDTAGITNEDYKEILSLCDLLLLDVKHTNENGYKSLTGGNFALALSFRDYLVNSQNPVWVRQVIVPGIHDNDEYLKSLKEYIKDLNVLRVDFLPYSSLAKEKYQKMNLVYPMGDLRAMDPVACEKLYAKYLNL